MGSNSARLYLLAEEDNRFVIQEKFRVMTRLIEGMTEDGALAEDAMARTVRTLADYANICRSAQADCLAIATAAVRKASNRADFTSRVLRETGIRLFVISGETEAYLDFHGVLASLPGLADFLVCDTGGGSSELILVQNQTLSEKCSLPFGALNLFDRFPDLDAAADYVNGKLAAVPFLQSAAGLPVVCLGGSMSATAPLGAKLLCRPITEINGTVFSPKELSAIYESLQLCTPEERLALGVERGRADTICHGILPTLMLLRRLQSPSAILCIGGLREGVIRLLEKCDNNMELFAKQLV